MKGFLFLLALFITLHPLIYAGDSTCVTVEKISSNPGQQDADDTTLKNDITLSSATGWSSTSFEDSLAFSFGGFIEYGRFLNRYLRPDVRIEAGTLRDNFIKVIEGQVGATLFLSNQSPFLPFVGLSTGFSALHSERSYLSTKQGAFILTPKAGLRWQAAKRVAFQVSFEFERLFVFSRSPRLEDVNLFRFPAGITISF